MTEPDDPNYVEKVTDGAEERALIKKVADVINATNEEREASGDEEIAPIARSIATTVIPHHPDLENDPGLESAIDYIEAAVIYATYLFLVDSIDYRRDHLKDALAIADDTDTVIWEAGGEKLNASEIKQAEQTFFERGFAMQATDAGKKFAAEVRRTVANEVQVTLPFVGDIGFEISGAPDQPTPTHSK